MNTLRVYLKLYEGLSSSSPEQAQKTSRVEGFVYISGPLPIVLIVGKEADGSVRDGTD